MGSVKKTSYMRLKKDIVIPAGTKFWSADGIRRNYIRDYYGHIFGLTKNSYGDLIYMIDPDDDPELNEWFEEVTE